MMLAKWKPVVVEDLFTPEQENDLRRVCDYIANYGAIHEPEFGRLLGGKDLLVPFLEIVVVRARQVFGVAELLPTYGLWARYDSPTSNLPAHKDKNACTYTLDYCVTQAQPWDLWVEGKPYTLEPGQALAFLGEDQEHWREGFEIGNSVDMVFFHFALPDHWYFDQ